jgi:hypothetical protein
MPRDIHSKTPYLASDNLYDSVKHFGANFPVNHFEGSQITNHIFDRKPVIIHDLRNRPPLDLDRNGGGWRVGGEEEEGDVAHVVNAYRYVLSPPSCPGAGGID